MNRIVCFHGNCPDGFGAAFAAWLKYGDADTEYVPCSYGKIPDCIKPENLNSETEILIGDFSFPPQQLIDMARVCKSVTVLDHHATAEKDLSLDTFIDLLHIDKQSLVVNKVEIDTPDTGKLLQVLGGKLNILFDMNRSGATITWNWLFPNDPVPEFFLYLQDRDLWKFMLSDSREVSCAVRSYPMLFETWVGMSAIFPTSLYYKVGTKTVHPDTARAMNRLRDEGRACLRLTNQMVDVMAKHHRWVVLDVKYKSIRFFPREYATECPQNGDPELVYYAPVANASVFFSEVGEALLKQYPSAQFAAYYSDRSDGKRQWGLRSRPSFDCSVIAKAFGGGGHPQAAGFTTDL